MVAHEDEKDHLTESYFCPLTKELFIDPVVTSDGNTFERHAIEQWLRTNDASPLTKEKLENKLLFPNPLIQKHILDHYNKYLARKAVRTSKVEEKKPQSEVERPVEVKKEEPAPLPLKSEEPVPKPVVPEPASEHVIEPVIQPVPEPVPPKP